MAHQGGIGHYVLKFISGKYQGGEFALEMNQELIIGRSSELEMVLIEDMVSRHHAKITTTDSEIFIEDLGSTNGTFVNGEKITSVKLKEGDRILIGTSIIKLVYESMPVLDNIGSMQHQSGQGTNVTMVASDIQPVLVSRQAERNRNMVRQDTRHSSTQSGILQGMIDQLPLPDILQLFGSSGKSGCLYVNVPPSTEGKIFLENGRVKGAVINNNFDVPMDKSFYRMMTWTKGTFLLDNTVKDDLPQSMDESVESLMMESMRLLDEIRALGPSVPAYTDSVSLKLPFESHLKELAPEALDVFELVLQKQQIEDILNASDTSDLDTLRGLIELIKKNFITVTQSA